jgi:hypothetical protein
MAIILKAPDDVSEAGFHSLTVVNQPFGSHWSTKIV